MKPGSKTARHLRCLAFAGALSAVGPGYTQAEAPLIEHHPLACSLPEKHPRVCATIADDGTVKRAKLYFRAKGEAAFFWTEMELDFRTFCATLPIPDAKTRSIEYHLWAIDDELSTNRTQDFEVSVDPQRTCDAPVIDEDPERTSRLVVWATTKKQKRLRGFEDEGVELHRIRKR